MVSRLGKDFQQPGAAYRGKPFWAWNGRLEPEELKRQIRHMHRMGLGGFFMHARVGLATPYLSEEWFAAVRTCVEEARRLGMEAWLYDEDRWPSGAAGGLVTRNPKYRMRSLEIEFFRDPKKFRWTRETLAAFTAVIEAPDRARDVRPIEEGHRPATLESERTIMAFRVELHDPSPWYNGQTYLDTMNPAAVRAFLRVTHDAYARRFAKDFGGIIPGIFTDEPNYGRTLPGDVRQTVLKALGLPWTDRLPTVFRRRYGYDLQPHLPELVFDIEGVKTSRARYHYHDCLTHLFVDAFARQCGEWCEKHGLQFTGHVLEEESLASQTNVVGSCMRFYEHMQAPGMDLLTERRREFITAKQVSSAARQFGRKWRLTETYGCTGWDFPFLGHKALGDWQAALGINLRCQHLYWYTMLAEAKRDYPAAIGHQSPWWDAYAKVEDYFARVQAVMTRGAEVRDVLVVHPVESVWMRVRAGWSNCPEIRALDDELRAVSDRLLEAHLDYDFGDEELLSRYGRIAVVGRRPALRVGRATYRAVVVPPQITMRRSTLELLKAFRRKGGRVVFAGRVATCLDAVPTDEVERFAAEGPRSSADGLDLATAVEDVARRVSIADGEGREIPTVLYLLREDAEAQYLFLCNTGERFSSGLEQNMARDRQLAWPDVRVRAFAGCVGVPLELDPETGATYTAEAEKDGDGWRLRTSLPALASRLFVTPRRATSDAPPRRWKGVESGRIVLEDGTWDIRRTEPNVLVLDRCAFRIGSDPEQPADEVLRVDARIRERMGLERRGGAMTQPWARPAMERPRSVPVELRYTIEVETPPEGPLGLGLERPEVFLLELNGVSLDPNSVKGWWTDASMQTLPVPPGALRRGTNELRLHLNYAETFSGLEPMYLLGEFGVRVEGAATTVIERPSRLRLGDWGEQGLPFYGGNVVYTRRLRIESGSSERVFLRLREFRGTAARIWTDGALVGVVAWPPFELEITESIRRAGGREIELAIEMLGHRRNSHGPLHYREKWPTWTGPGQMQPGPSDFVEFYQLVPCGLLAAPEAVVRRQAEGEEA
jgi:hypothetical protein